MPSITVFDTIFAPHKREAGTGMHVPTGRASRASKQLRKRAMSKHASVQRLLPRRSVPALNGI